MSNNEDTVTISVDARLASMVDELVSLRSENAKLRGVIAAQNKVTMAATDELEALRVYARAEIARNAGVVAENAKLRDALKSIVLAQELWFKANRIGHDQMTAQNFLNSAIEAARLLLEGGAQ
jgi:regulator of replication initiation timing